MRDQITIKTANGETYSNVAASVQGNMVMTFRTGIPIRQGDQIIRLTPAGVEELFIVEDPGFYSKFGSIPANYQMQVRRATPAPTKSSAMAAPETAYVKAFRMLLVIYEKTRASKEPIMVEDIRDELGLSKEDAEAAWRYLRDKNLIQTFKIDYAARINAYGEDAVEADRLHPDEPAKNFPSVTYNVVNVQYMVGSTIQQGGDHAIITKKDK
jgi:hypothetical protein